MSWNLHHRPLACCSSCDLCISRRRAPPRVRRIGHCCAERRRVWFSGRIWWEKLTTMRLERRPREAIQVTSLVSVDHPAWHRVCSRRVRVGRRAIDARCDRLARPRRREQRWSRPDREGRGQLGFDVGGGRTLWTATTYSPVATSQCSSGRSSGANAGGGNGGPLLLVAAVARSGSCGWQTSWCSTRQA